MTKFVIKKKNKNKLLVTRKKSLKILKIYYEKSLKKQKNFKKFYKIVRKKKVKLWFSKNNSKEIENN